MRIFVEVKLWKHVKNLIHIIDKKDFGVFHYIPTKNHTYTPKVIQIPL